MGTCGCAGRPGNRVSSTVDRACHAYEAVGVGHVRLLPSRCARRAQVQKTYMALVRGRLEGAGSVESPLDRRPSLTRWRVLGHTRSAEHNWVTTVHLHPHTGARAEAFLIPSYRGSILGSLYTFLHARGCPGWPVLGEGPERLLPRIQEGCKYSTLR